MNKPIGKDINQVKRKLKGGKMKNLKEVVEIMDNINSLDDEYEYNRLYFFENDEWYKKILEAVIKLRQYKKSN